MKLSKNMILGGFLVLLIIATAVAYFLGENHAAQSISIKRVTPGILANAMRDDHFYSDYGRSSLLVRGTVMSVSGDVNNPTVSFKTDSSYSTICNFVGGSAAIHKGGTITVLSEGGKALRQSSGVLLKDCVLP